MNLDSSHKVLGRALQDTWDGRNTQSGKRMQMVTLLPDRMQDWTGLIGLTPSQTWLHDTVIKEVSAGKDWTKATMDSLLP